MQFNSDSLVQPSEKTSTYWAGLLNTQVSLQSNVVFEDETITVYISHSEFGVLVGLERRTEENLRENLEHWRSIMDNLERGLRDKGYDEYFAIVSSPEAFKFCKHFNFESAYVVFNNSNELMRKEIGRTSNCSSRSSYNGS